MHYLGSLANNQICGQNEYGTGTYTYGKSTYTTKGIDALCEALKSTSTLTSLKHAATPTRITPHR